LVFTGHSRRVKFAPARHVEQRSDELAHDLNHRALLQLLGVATSALVPSLHRRGALDLENRLVRETKRYDLPYVFVRGEPIGGFAERAALAKSGELTRRAAET
jgi:hypothetical protein